MNCSLKDSRKIYPSISQRFFICLLLGLLICGCRHASHHITAQYFDLQGQIVSVDREKQEVTIAHEEIEGLMGAMTMPFKVKNHDAFEVMSAGDHIQATLAIADGRSWIENPVITKGAGAAGPGSMPFSSESRINNAVPNFSLVNQDGKSIKLHQYRGQALLITFIYTRCPVPDYCTLMSTNFAELSRELHQDTSMKARTHLLSVTIDPAYDTPKVLKSYGGAHTGNYRTETFDHWEFATGTHEEIRQLAEFFGLTYQDAKDQIVHSLCTAIIAPDGRVHKIYRGNEWKPSQLLRDLDSLLNDVQAGSPVQ